jgi:Cu-Zn family superoxide dismutase
MENYNMRQGKLFNLAATITLSICVTMSYASVTIPIYLTSQTGQGKNIGGIKAEDSMCGVLLTPDLHGLSPGIHGFHIHVNPACGDNGMAAGGHLDPQNTQHHDGPYNNHGHLGDMPVLIVNQDGSATLPTLAPRFKLAQIVGHAFMIHAGEDNYSDQPQKLGGGGSRIACGVITAG